MTSKIVVNNIEADSGISTVTFNSKVASSEFVGNVTGNVTGNITGQISGIQTSITVGDTAITSTSIGIGTTTIAGRNAGVGTAPGTLVFTADGGTLYVYTGSSGWSKLATNSSATGGTVTEVGSRTIHTFTSPGPFTVNGSITADILVVAGGGAGGRGSWTSGSGSEGAGGGGAGGLRYRSSTPISAGTYDVEVGTGGAGGTNSDLFSSGSPSFITGISSATGGGVGGYCPASAVAANPDSGNNDYWGRKGGSGGGSTSGAGQGGDSLASPDGISPTVQGFAGGSSNGTGNGGGGGGAGGAGTSNASTANTGGGPGLPYSISGSNYTYSAGGNVNTPGGVNGANYGDGGGSSPFGSTDSGAGADGIVIISWE